MFFIYLKCIDGLVHTFKQISRTGFTTITVVRVADFQKPQIQN